MLLTSLENDKIKFLIKLQNKKYRDSSGEYVVEGYHLVEEAYKAGYVLEVYSLEETCPFSVPFYQVTPEIMDKVSTTDTRSSIVALCKKKEDSEIIGDKILLLDEVQDPGNLGTIIRSSVAFGIDTIVLSENTVDLYNPKVLRATQGMYCHIPIVTRNSKEALVELKSKGYTLFGTNVVHGVDVKTLEKNEKKKFCLVVGNEGAGVRPEIQELCDKNLYISMKNNVESLNVGVACSILLYELGE